MFAKPFANVFAHLRRAGFARYAAHTDAGEVDTEFRRPDDGSAHEARDPPKHSGTMALDHVDGFVERTMHIEITERRAHEGRRDRSTGRVCVHRRTHEGPHRRWRQRKEIHQDIVFTNSRNLTHSFRQTEIGHIIVRGDIERCRIAGRARRIVHFPERPLFERQILDGAAGTLPDRPSGLSSRSTVISRDRRCCGWSQDRFHAHPSAAYRIYARDRRARICSATSLFCTSRIFSIG